MLPRNIAASIVSGDGDFYCPIEHPKENDKLLYVMVPNDRFSKFLRRFTIDIVRINLLRDRLKRRNVAGLVFTFRVWS
jgi:hypothetical protein